MPRRAKEREIEMEVKKTRKKVGKSEHLYYIARLCPNLMSLLKPNTKVKKATKF